MRVLFFIIHLISVAAFADEEKIYQLEQRINELTNKLEHSEHKYLSLEKKFEQFAKDIEYRLSHTLSNNNASIIKKAENINKLSEQNDKAAFENAYQSLKERNYDEAESLLTNFVQQFPKSNYAGNAYYWLGESFILRERFDKAATNYILSFTKFPNGSKSNIAKIKLMKVLNLLGKNKEACAELKKLNEEKSKFDNNLQKLFVRESKKIECKKY